MKEWFEEYVWSLVVPTFGMAAAIAWFGGICAGTVFPIYYLGWWGVPIGIPWLFFSLGVFMWAIDPHTGRG